MDNNAFAQELESRARRFSTLVLKLAAVLPPSADGREVASKLITAGSGIGLNYRLANNAKRQEDFFNRIKGTEEAAIETIYWLEVVSDMGWLQPKLLQPVQQEAVTLLEVVEALFTQVRSVPIS